MRKHARKWMVGLVMVFGSSLSMSGVRGAHAADPSWEAQYAHLCSYDFYWCGLAKLADGSFVEPTMTGLGLLRHYRAEILEKSRLFGADPRAVTAALLADMSLTPVWEESLRDHLRVLNEAVAAGGGIETIETPELQLGIVYPAPALHVEPFAARLEGRPERSREEIEKLLLTPRGTVYYAAAIVREAVDIFAQYGFDISAMPDYQATCYNLGRNEERARKLKETGQKPAINFFGFFSRRSMPLIEKTLREDDPLGIGSGWPATSPEACVAETAAARTEFQAATATLSAPEILPESLEMAVVELRAAMPDAAALTELGDQSGSSAGKQKLRELLQSLAGSPAMARLCQAAGTQPALHPKFARLICPGVVGAVDQPAISLSLSWNEKSGHWGVLLCGLRESQTRSLAMIRDQRCVWLDGVAEGATPTPTHTHDVEFRASNGYPRRRIPITRLSHQPKYVRQVIPFDCVK